MPEPMLLSLQRTLASIVLEPYETHFTSNHEGFAAGHGLSKVHRVAVGRFQERLLTYRELARMSLSEPLEDMFPILKALLGSEQVWDTAVEQFLLARCISSPHYRDIAPTFLGWLVETRWGQERWPFLAELAHFELLEVLVARFPDATRPAVESRERDLTARIVLDPSAQIVAYNHAVHRTREDAPIPEAEATYLLAFRDLEGDAQILELTDTAAALLTQAQTVPLGEAMRRIANEDLEALDALLEDLLNRGAVLGFATSN